MTSTPFSRSQSIPPAKVLLSPTINCADPELPHEPAAIPARRQRGHHYHVAVTLLPAGSAKGIGFPVDAGIAFLHPAVVSSAQEFACPREHGGADRNATFGTT